jgi:hypothetical protein
MKNPTTTPLRKTNGLIKRHTRRESLCITLAARGTAGLALGDVITLDAFRFAQTDEIRTQVNNAIGLGLIDARTETGTELHRVREVDNFSRVTLYLTLTGVHELPSHALVQPATKPAVMQPRRQRITAAENPLERQPITRPGSEDHRQHQSRIGNRLTSYTPHP